MIIIQIASKIVIAEPLFASLKSFVSESFLYSTKKESLCLLFDIRFGKNNHEERRSIL